MVLRRPGSIHRRISMNSNMEQRKMKKFRLRMKAKRERRGIPKKGARVAPEDVGLISRKAIKRQTRVNPIASVKLSNKKRNKILKQLRYRERDQQAEQAAEEEASTSRANEMEIEKVSKKQSKAKKTLETMECE